MKRTTKKEIFKSNLIFVILGLLSIVCSIILFRGTAVYIEPPEYDNLNIKKVTVSELETHLYYSHKTHIETHYFLLTQDNESFHIDGKLSSGDIKDVLKQGTEAEVKWYKDADELYIIKELTVDGEKIVEYTEDNYRVYKISGIVLAVIFFSVGIILLLIYRYLVKISIEKMKKREMRIEKKYGNKNKKA
ncbi:MAG: hypothetical protein IJ279_02175 [Clostridia bacterium]|nr:hypothetical protein [Clostridia bacterium]